jgi:hypothetical protein
MGKPDTQTIIIGRAVQTDTGTDVELSLAASKQLATEIHPMRIVAVIRGQFT